MLQRNCLLLLLLLPREHERHHGRVQDVHDTVSHRCAGAACTRGAQARLERRAHKCVCVFKSVCSMHYGTRGALYERMWQTGA